MGKFDGKFLRGLIGSAIFREQRGQQIVYGKCTKSKIARTQKTKEAAKVFGKASTLASYIRMVMMGLTQRHFDGSMSTRLTADLISVLHDATIPGTQIFDFYSTSFNRLIGFELNLKSPFKNTFLAQPVVSHADNTVYILLPEMIVADKIKFPHGIRDCKLVINRSQFYLKYGHYSETEYIVLDFNKVNDDTVFPQEIRSFTTEPGCLCLIGISLQFYETTFIGNNLINNKSFSPAAILSAFITEGQVDPLVMKTWNNMEFKTHVAPQIAATTLLDNAAV